MKTYAVFLLPLLFLAGCAHNYLLDKEEISRLHYTPSSETSTVFYSKIFTVGAADELAVKTHSIVRVGENIRNIPDFLTVYDGSMDRLTAFQARVLHKNGSADTYGKGDLNTVALSNRYIIAESSVKYLPIEEKVSAGDYIETVAIHEAALGRLGMDFHLSEAGSNAENIECAMVLPLPDSLHYIALDDSIAPLIRILDDRKIYRFSWPSYTQPDMRFIFGRRNRGPGILSFSERIGSDDERFQWQRFGDWYLKLIENRLAGDKSLEAKARELTTGKSTSYEKLEAIAAWCQEQVRYEQVYLAHGEFIPNDVKAVFARKYGDCKDYAVLMYAMAQAVGVEPHLALCRRGQGFKFRPEIAVAQFNHMILHYSDGSRNYWYDGTNGAGKPGVTADDLINATALVLEPSNSRLVRIDEMPENLLSITGSLTTHPDGLAGDLRIDLGGQYAIVFQTVSRLLGSKDVKQWMVNWLRQNLNGALVLQEVRWQAQGDRFVLTARCVIPNALIMIPPAAYLRFSTLFPKLMPEGDPAQHPDQVFYYPGYSRVRAEITLPEFSDSASAAGPGAGLHKMLEYRLPSGPFEKEEAHRFVTAYAKASAEFTASCKIYRKDSK